jgi:hypothetical protein
MSPLINNIPAITVVAFALIVLAIAMYWAAAQWCTALEDLKHAKTCSHRLAAGAFRHTIKDTAMRMRTLILSAVFSIFGMVPASRAQEIGDVQQGRQLALDVCASCHAVRAGQTQSPLATAPSFEEIAHTPGMTPAALTFWLTAQSHPTMPNLILSPQQVRNVSAYLLSLRDN